MLTFPWRSCPYRFQPNTRRTGFHCLFPGSKCSPYVFTQLMNFQPMLVYLQSTNKCSGLTTKQTTIPLVASMMSCYHTRYSVVSRNATRPTSYGMGAMKLTASISLMRGTEMKSIFVSFIFVGVCMKIEVVIHDSCRHQRHI